MNPPSVQKLLAVKAQKLDSFFLALIPLQWKRGAAIGLKLVKWVALQHK